MPSIKCGICSEGTLVLSRLPRHPGLPDVLGRITLLAAAVGVVGWIIAMVSSRGGDFGDKVMGSLVWLGGCLFVAVVGALAAESKEVLCCSVCRASVAIE